MDILKGSRNAFVVLSADLSGLSESDNRKRRIQLRRDLALAGLNFHPCIGSYKGVQENSYLVLTSTWDDLRECVAIATDYGQESVLAVDDNNRATLLFMPKPGEQKEIDHSIAIGYWTPISQIEATTLDAWTQYGNQYFTTAPQRAYV